MRNSKILVAAFCAAATTLGSAGAAVAAERPVGSITTYFKADGSSTTLECQFSDNPSLEGDCGRNGGDGDGLLETFKDRRAVRAVTRVRYADGSRSPVLTDFVVLDGRRTLLMQAVGVDNATVVFKLDGGARMVRTRAGKQDVIDNLRSEGKLTPRLRDSLEGEDPFLRS